MKTKSVFRWENRYSSWHPRYEGAMLEAVDGDISNGETIVHFTVNRQHAAKARYVFRGAAYITARTGGVQQMCDKDFQQYKVKPYLQKSGKKNSPVTGNEDENPGDIESEEIAEAISKRSRDARCSIYALSDSEETLKEKVIEAAEYLLRRFSETLKRREPMPHHPDHIRPLDALEGHATSFFREYHPRTKERTRKEYTANMQKFLASLPAEPMASFTARQIELKLAEKKPGTRVQKHLYEFWSYCIAHKICSGENPFPQAREERQSPTALQNKVGKARSMPLDMQDRLIEMLLKSATGYDCMVALMLSGFELDEAVHMTWRRVLFDAKRDDHVRMLFLRPALAGSTHNFTRALLPGAALVLRKRFEQLCKNKPVEKVLDEFVVGKAFSRKKKTSTNKTGSQKGGGEESETTDSFRLIREDVVRYANKVISMVDSEGILATKKRGKKPGDESAARSLLRDTYKKDVAEMVDLKNEPGSYKFLLGQALGHDSTSDDYAPFTSEEGAKRLYSLLKPLGPNKEIEEVPLMETLDDGRVLYRIRPKRTRERAGVVIRANIKKGETPEVRCAHGVVGKVEAKEHPEK